MSDPLVALPAEIVLRIIDFTTATDAAHLTQLNKTWCEFVDVTHREHIYSAASKTERPSTSRNFSFLKDAHSFARYYDGVAGWKDLCKRQALLKRNWLSERPTTTESVLQVGNTPVWRFRPDFKRRFIISTSQSGGVSVTDMDDGRLLWHLPEDDVRPYAHLEYQDGTAVWDRWGNAVEVWKVDDNQRGTFNRTAILQHECETRGFQLSFDTLCVVSSEAEGFVYDMTQDPPLLKTHMDIETEAVGHLYQNQSVVVYSMGKKGFHFHDKNTGELMGVLQPNTCSNTYHIRHPTSPPNSTIATARHGPTRTLFPPQHPRKDRLVPLHLENGPHPARANPLNLEDDEWGSGMISENFMVGVSRGGRAFICSDWQAALSNPERAAASSAIIECESDGSTFDLGGWLAISNARMLFEISDRVYIFTLNQHGPLPETGSKRLPAWATSTSSAPQLTVPVSFMAIYDDCLMATFTVSTLPASPSPCLCPVHD